MRNLFLVAKHSIWATIRTRSFWIMSLIVPVVMLAIQAYAAIKESQDWGNTPANQEEQAKPTEVAKPLNFGLVDEASVIRNLPPGFPQDPFIRYSNLEAARVDLDSGMLQQVVFIPKDYLQTGQVEVYDRDFQIAIIGSSDTFGFNSNVAWLLPYLISYNLTGDAQLSAALGNPTPGNIVQYHALQPPVEVGEKEQARALMVGRLMPYIFYFLLIFSSSYLLQSVTAEKENRTAEVLLTSVQPKEFMAGKVIGLGIVTLIQFLIWLAGGYFVLQRGSAMLGIAALDLPASFLGWACLFMLLGFLVYGGIMAAGGAIAPTAREGNQLIWILILPMMPTLLFVTEFAENPNGPIPVILSLIPFSAPSAMVTRMAVTDVPLWQVLLSLVGLVVTAYLIIILAGRFFRAENLLSTAAFSYKRFLKGWKA